MMPTTWSRRSRKRSPAPKPAKKDAQALVEQAFAEPQPARKPKVDVDEVQTASVEP